MDMWVGKVAVVTGASSGIGAAIALVLANLGLHVIGLARRTPLVDELSTQVSGNGSIRSRSCDVSKLDDVIAAFKWVEQEYGGVDVLINNAGVAYPGHITDIELQQASDEQISAIIDINVKGVIHCTRQAISSMHQRNATGHVININSIAGHYVAHGTIFNVYSASKYAVTAFTGSLQSELVALKSGIRVTSISPGIVQTPLTAQLLDFSTTPHLDPADVADTVVYALSRPPHVQISELTLEPVGLARF